MRKMWAAGAAVLVCLTLGGLPVAGQDESEPTGAVWVTGTASCPTVDSGHHDHRGRCRTGARDGHRVHLHIERSASR